MYVCVCERAADSALALYYSLPCKSVAICMKNALTHTDTRNSARATASLLCCWWTTDAVLCDPRRFEHNIVCARFRERARALYIKAFAASAYQQPPPPPPPPTHTHTRNDAVRLLARVVLFVVHMGANTVRPTIIYSAARGTLHRCAWRILSYTIAQCRFVIVIWVN